MSLEGYTVTHKAFGVGQVLRSDEHYITVRFSEKEKTFVYPDVFNGFMTISDDTANNVIHEDLKRSGEEAALAEENRRREVERQKACGVVIPGFRPPVDHEPTFAASQEDGEGN